MAAEFQLSVVAPDRSVVDEPIQSVVLPGTEGYLGILAGHEPAVVGLKAGILEFLDRSSNRHYVSVTGGFAEVTGAKVTILADAAERAQDIDVARAERALENARAALRGDGASGVSRDIAVAEMERAMTRIKAGRLR